MFGSFKKAKGKPCAECGQEFSLTNIERSAYRMKELPVPDRCRACRNTGRSGGELPHQQPSILRRANSGS